jgi:tRNA G18 (ribose-2'-O)-methylase SpoU
LYCFIKGVSLLFSVVFFATGIIQKLKIAVFDAALEPTFPQFCSIFEPSMSEKSTKKLKLWELDRLDEAQFKAQPKFPIVVVLDSIRSLNNIGAFFRTADAFNIEHIVLCGITAQPPHREIHKTALGATETVQWSYEADLMTALEKQRKKGYQIGVVEQAVQTTLLQDIHTIEAKGFALVFGNEVDGVDQRALDVADHIIEIPQFGTKHSLNVSVCAGIVMWEFVKRYI